VNDSRNVAEYRQQYIEPEVSADADLQKYAQRREKNGKDDSNEIIDTSSFILLEPL